MQIAILSDIHGNLEALEAVLGEVDQVKPDIILSLGDNIGYGPDPEKVMGIMEERRIPSVLGNHELALKQEDFIRWFNPISKEAVFHARRSLSHASLQRCRAYPAYRIFEKIRFVHGVPPASPAIYLHQVSDGHLISRLEKIKERISFVGHTHRIALIEYEGGRLLRKTLGEEPVILKEDRRYIVNAGSVGQPRDGDSRARFLLFDTRENRLEVRFVPYDYEKTAEKIVREGLPRVFAENLYPNKERGNRKG